MKLVELIGPIKEHTIIYSHNRTKKQALVKVSPFNQNTSEHSLTSPLKEHHREFTSTLN